MSEAAPPSARGPVGVEGTALIIDDDEATRRLVVRWLTHGGLRCMEARDGEQGLRILREAHARIDVVVLDVMMPGVSGYDVLSTIQAEPAIAEVPVLLLTAHANRESDLVEAAERGAADHLSKPFSGPVLKAKALRAARARRATRDRLEHAEELARIDPLTQLGNRQHLVERLREELAFAQRQRTALSLCMLDLDHFKSINDRFGHETGDRALALFARTLAATLRAEDGAFRYGGEEFVVLLRQEGEEGARAVLARVRESLEKAPLELPGGGREALSFSGGIAVVEGADPGDADGHLRRADAALYEAKRSGRARDCVVSY